MAQSLSQIIKSLDAGYAPSRKLINQEIDALPAQFEAQNKGLKATKNQAFEDITAGARDRGMGFSGIPLSEQADYTASTFLPAMAKLKANQNTATNTLTEALNSLNRNQRNTAMGIRQDQLALDEKRRQEEAARKAQQAAQQAQQRALQALYGGSDTKQTSAEPTLPGGMSYKKGDNGKAGFNFNWGNKAASAATWAKIHNVPITDLLYSMANSGDAYAANAYRTIVHNNGKITPGIMRRYSSLFWGEIPTASRKIQHGSTPSWLKTNNTQIDLFGHNPRSLR